MKKNDFILIGIIVIVASSIYLVKHFYSQNPGEVVNITVDGEKYLTLPLGEDAEVAIEGVNAGTNYLIIKDGYADMIDGSCPDELCVHQKSIQYNGEMIVCLPNKVVVQVISGNESTLDAISN